MNLFKHNNKVKARLLCGALVLSLLTAIPYFVCSADEFDKQIANMKQEEKKTKEAISNLEKQTEETKEAIAMLQGQREAIADNVSDLRGQSYSLQSKINGYSEQLDVLTDEIAGTESAMSETSSQIIRLNTELEDIRQQRNDRYELLTNRLRTI